MGLYPATYDFASAPSIVTDYIAAPAIIHLHGQGFGQSMMNSDEETRRHAESLRPLVRDCLAQAPFLVIGYSGSSDAVFPMFKAEYEGRERLWWGSHDTEPAIHVREILNKGDRTADFVGGAEADFFLVELARGLGCFPPKLFEDPYGHLLDELEPVADFPLGTGGEEDILSALRAELQTVTKTRKESAVAGVMQSFVRGDWEKVIDRANPEDPKERGMLASALIMRGAALSNLAKLKQDEGLYRESFEKYARAVEIKPDSHEAFNNWGNALSGLAKLKQDEGLYRESFEKYARALEIKPDMHEAPQLGQSAVGPRRTEAGRRACREAFEKYARALEIKPDKSRGVQQLGQRAVGPRKVKQDEGRAARPSRSTPARWKSSRTCTRRSTTGARAVGPAELKQDEGRTARPSRSTPARWKSSRTSTRRPTTGATRCRPPPSEAGRRAYRETGEKYARALEIKPDMHEASTTGATRWRDLAEPKQGRRAHRSSRGRREVRARAGNQAGQARGVQQLGRCAVGPAKLKQARRAVLARLARSTPARWKSSRTCTRRSTTGATRSSDLAELKQDEGLYRESFEKHARAAEIKPDKHEAFYNWGAALQSYWRLTKDEAALKEAREVLNRAEELNPDKAYNSACLDAVTGDIEGCRRRLERCKEKGTLPSRAQMLEDPDLESVRSLGWFKALLADLPD